MKCESGVTRSVIDELHFWDIQGEKMEGERCVIRSIMEELHFPDIQGDQIDVESGAT